MPLEQLTLCRNGIRVRLDRCPLFCYSDRERPYRLLVFARLSVWGGVHAHYNYVSDD